MKYRLKDGKTLRKLAFARRKIARNRAYHWYQQAKAKEKPLAPPKPKLKPTSQQKLTKIQERIKSAETQIKRLSTYLKKLKRQEKYYLKKIAEGEMK